MSKMSSEEKSLSLPPFCEGKLRGNLNLVIEKVNWKTSKSFNNVKVNVLWWGQRRGYSSEIAKSSAEPIKTIQYQIKTNQRLFKSYLENCDPLVIEFYSSKTNDFIGTSKIKISPRLQSDFCLKISGEILSKRDFSLGEVTVVIRMEELKVPKVTFESIKIMISEKIQTSDDSKVMRKGKSFNKENVPVCNAKKVSFLNPEKQNNSSVENFESSRKHGKSNISLICDKLPSIKSDDVSKDKPIFKYLTGEPMSKVQELRILENLAENSPSQSVIKSLHNASERKGKVLNKIHSIRIRILKAEFNFTGQKEQTIFMSQNLNESYVVKCAIISKLFRTNDEIKMLSPVFKAFPQQAFQISFLQELHQLVALPVSCEKAAFLNFGFSLKPTEQHPSQSFFLGFSRVNIQETIKANGIRHKRCPIISEKGAIVGTILLKLEVGSHNRMLHDQNIHTMSQTNLGLIENQKFQTTSHPSSSNDACETERNYENKKTTAEKQATEDRREMKNYDYEDNNAGSAVDFEKHERDLKSKVYQGLLFIEQLHKVKDSSSTEYFITYEGFWNECQESTQVSVGMVLNYLKQFPVICDELFLKRVQNNHLELKLWESSEKLVGSTKIPLHQFFIAFRDVAMIEHLSSNHLPIISIDTFTNFISPLSNELFCQAKVLLAIGSDSQIEYLKLSRKLNTLSTPQQLSLNESDSSSSNVNVKNKLTAFIESLSQKLPETEKAFHKFTPPLPPSPLPSQLRKTSDLLESLQKALLKAPQPPATAQKSSVNSSTDSESCSQQKRIRVLITLEHACHLPKVVKRRQNRRKNRNNANTFEFEPSSYATFDSSLDSQKLDEKFLPENVVKSHEGLVHCTNVIKASVDPQWNQSYDVKLPLDILTNSQKRFIVKIWRKCAQESDMRPAPFEDAVIGFTAVDLSVLLTGLPILSGYYNITDFSGRCNGQIKLTFKPSESLVEYQISSPSPSPSPNVLLNPLNVDVNLSDDGSSLLSRTLKRKFTELDEITQRLKARLYDVTGDENFDPDEEFERDLNTAVDEDMEEDPIEFGWLKNDPNGNGFEDFSNSYQSKLNNFLQLQPSTSKSVMGSSSTIPTQRLVSGCSNSSSSPMAIDQLLKKYDLDTLINPSIFKNILDPSLANSDSTPTLNPNPTNIDVSGDSGGDTTVSSIISNDQVQSIQNALQHTSITDLERKDGDGNFSE